VLPISHLRPDWFRFFSFGNMRGAPAVFRAPLCEMDLLPSPSLLYDPQSKTTRPPSSGHRPPLSTAPLGFYFCRRTPVRNARATFIMPSVRLTALLGPAFPLGFLPRFVSKRRGQQGLSHENTRPTSFFCVGPPKSGTYRTLATPLSCRAPQSPPQRT